MPEMQQVEVHAENGEVIIEQVQDCGENRARVVLHPDQVPLLCEWLKAAAGPAPVIIDTSGLKLTAANAGGETCRTCRRRVQRDDPPSEAYGWCHWRQFKVALDQPACSAFVLITGAA